MLQEYDHRYFFFFASCCFQVLTRGAKSIFSIDDKFEIIARGSNNLQTLVKKTWMQPVHRPPKEQ
jgi:hypothetical protein